MCCVDLYNFVSTFVVLCSVEITDAASTYKNNLTYNLTDIKESLLH